MIVFANLPDELAGLEVSISRWLQEVAIEYDARIKHLEYSFISDPDIQAINRKYLNHDYPTDIITFGYKEGSKISGEVYVGAETIRINARDLAVDYTEELARVIVHGMLHLIGFDDGTEEEKRAMREQEEKCLLLRPKKLIGREL